MRLSRLWMLCLVFVCFATVAKAQNFCGANTVTYYRADSAAGDAVMCVLFVDRNSFAFYAQGTEHGQTFRLLGYSHRKGAPQSEAFDTSYATINGNGEQFAQGAHLGGNTFILSEGFWDEHNPPARIYHHLLESEA